MAITSIFIIVIVAIIVIAVVGYVSTQGENAGATKTHQAITPDVYQESYAPRQHLLVDVRTAEEFKSGHIPGAVNVALPELPQQMKTLPKDQPIVLYCRSGARSRAAARMLAESGFEDVHDLGGIIRWQAQGLPVISTE